MNVTYILNSRYSSSFRDTYVMELQNSGHRVTIWEALDALRPATGAVCPVAGFPSDTDWRRFDSMDDLVAAARALDRRELVIPLVHYDKKSHALYHALHLAGVTLVGLHPKTCPDPFKDLSAPHSIAARLHTFRRSWGSWNKIRTTVALSPAPGNSAVGLPAMAALIVNSRHPRTCPYPQDGHTRQIMAPSLDFNRMVHWRRNGSPLQGVRQHASKPLVVFIDGIAPRHPDLVGISRQRQTITEEGFYPPVRSMLQGMEAQGAQVVVAAHPRASHEGWLEHYADFQVIRGKTLELIAESDMVVNNFSTAASFAVYLRKPIIYCTTDEMIAGEYDAFIRFQAQLLGRVPHNISRQPRIELERENVIDEELYRTYQEEYILPLGVDPEKSFWETVLPELERLT